MSIDRRRRRHVLHAIGSGIAFGLAGCVGDDEPDPEDGNRAGVTPVSVRAENHETEGADITVRIRYGTSTVSELPDGAQIEPPTPGRKVVIFSSEITVTAVRSNPISMTEEMLALETTDDRYHARSINNQPTISAVVTPPEIYPGWAHFEVPEGVTEARLIAFTPGMFFDLPVEILFEEDSFQSPSIS